MEETVLTALHLATCYIKIDQEGKLKSLHILNEEKWTVIDLTESPGNLGILGDFIQKYSPVLT